MQDLTNKDKVRIFGQYLTSEVEYVDHVLEDVICTRKGYLTGLKQGNGFLELEIQMHDGLHADEEATLCDPNYCKLVLIPMSELTEAHAIEVAKLMVNDGVFPVNDYEPRISESVEDRIVVKISNKQLHIFFTGQLLATSNSAGEHDRWHIYNTQHVADYLRAEGYALPYMGIDLYEAGIAIKPQSK